jgi:hypothetical protein
LTQQRHLDEVVTMQVEEEAAEEAAGNEAGLEVVFEAAAAG